MTQSHERQDAAHYACAHMGYTSEECLAIDTGQFIDTGQLAEYAHADCLEVLGVSADDLLNENASDAACMATAFALNITKHQIHRVDQNDAGQEHVISTLKYFELEVSLQDASGNTNCSADGMQLHAELVYEDGQIVTERSVTGEPPLLGVTAVLDGGLATLRLRTTVLTSLCGKRNFSVRVWAEGRPELAPVVSAPFKTITKLRRGSRGESAGRDALRNQTAGFTNTPVQDLVACGKRALDTLGADFASLQGSPPRRLLTDENVEWGSADHSARSMDELWDEVASNGSRLLQLQAEQRRLFKELRTMRLLKGGGTLGGTTLGDGSPYGTPSEMPSLVAAAQ